MKSTSHLISIIAATVLLLSGSSAAQAQTPTSTPVAVATQTTKPEDPNELVKKAARFLSFFMPSTVWKSAFSI